MLITYVEATGTTKKTGPSPLPSVIETLSEPENSSNIEEVNGPGPVLRDHVNKHKTEAAKIRLTTKPSSALGLPARTKDYVKCKKEAYNAASDQKNNAPITFWCELSLQTDTGKKVGTHVPMQSRGFQQLEVSFLKQFSCYGLTKQIK